MFDKTSSSDNYQEYHTNDHYQSIFKENIENAAAAKRAKATVDKKMGAPHKQSQKSQQEKNIVRMLAGKKAALTRKENKAAQLAQYFDKKEEVVVDESPPSPSSTASLSLSLSLSSSVSLA
jgi:hypothetical protein